jgi:hypothetical protein
MHQQHFTRFDLAAIDQRVMRGAVGGEKRRPLGIVECRRQRSELRRRHHDLVGIAAMAQLDDDAITDRDARHIAGDFADVAGRFHARRERQFGLELIFAGRHQDIRKIDPGGAHGNADLPGFQRH